MLSFIAVILDFKNPATVENILELFLEPVMHKETSLNKPWEGTVFITISANVKAVFLGHLFQ